MNTRIFLLLFVVLGCQNRPSSANGKVFQREHQHHFGGYA
jgi:hypothetical protein